jgi:hypothetical protein
MAQTVSERLIHSLGVGWTSMQLIKLSDGADGAGVFFHNVEQRRFQYTVPGDANTPEKILLSSDLAGPDEWTSAVVTRFGITDQLDSLLFYAGATGKVALFAAQGVNHDPVHQFIAATNFGAGFSSVIPVMVTSVNSGRLNSDMMLYSFLGGARYMLSQGLSPGQELYLPADGASGLNARFTTVMPITLETGRTLSDVFLYNANTGRCMVRSATDNVLQGADPLGIHLFDRFIEKGYTAFCPILDSSSVPSKSGVGLAAYNAISGKLTLFIGSDGSRFTQARPFKISPGWTNMVPRRTPQGEVALLLYNTLTGITAYAILPNPIE